MTMAK